MLFERTAFLVSMSGNGVEWWSGTSHGAVMTAEGEGAPGDSWVVRCGIYFRLPKIQCIPSKWTKRFLEAHNCLEDFLYSSYSSNSRNCFSPTMDTFLLTYTLTYIYIYIYIHTHTEYNFSKTNSLFISTFSTYKAHINALFFTTII